MYLLLFQAIVVEREFVVISGIILSRPPGPVRASLVPAIGFGLFPENKMIQLFIRLYIITPWEIGKRKKSNSTATSCQGILLKVSVRLNGVVAGKTGQAKIFRPKACGLD